MKDVQIKDLANEAKKAYFKEWRSKNKDKVKIHNERFWSKRAEQIAEEKANQNKDI